MTKTLVLGHTGLLGSEIYKLLKDNNSIVTGVSTAQCNLEKDDLFKYLTDNGHTDITHVVICAGCVGGIMFNNNNQFSQLKTNAIISLNIFESIIKLQKQFNNIQHVINMSSTCNYGVSSKPHKEEELFTTLSELEPTNLGYSISKLIGCFAAKLSNVRTTNLILTNLYGEADCFNSERGHVIPQIISKIINAKNSNSPTVQLLGDGTPVRNFMFAKDAANIIVNYILFKEDSLQDESINIASPISNTIKDVAHIIKLAVGYDGQILFSKNKKENGTKIKEVCIEKMNKLIKHDINITLLEDGIRTVVNSQK